MVVGCDGVTGIAGTRGWGEESGESCGERLGAWWRWTGGGCPAHDRPGDFDLCAFFARCVGNGLVGDVLKGRAQMVGGKTLPWMKDLGRGGAWGGGCPSLVAAPATLTCAIFRLMRWQWVGWWCVEVSSSKGGRKTVKAPHPRKPRPHVYTQSFQSSSTTAKIEEAGGSIPSFSN